VPWWVAQLQPNRTRVAVGHLRLFGFEIYNPHVVERRKAYAKYVTVEQQLFPNYLFVAVTVTRGNGMRPIRHRVSFGSFAMGSRQPWWATRWWRASAGESMPASCGCRNVISFPAHRFAS
jgi:Transcription termination factor nusG